MKTFFCLTKEYLPSEQWIHDLIAGKPVEVPVGGGRCLSINWIYQTWALLISSGTPCYGILDNPATEGIIIALSVAASRSLKMPNAPFFIDIVADDTPHPAAHLHIVQNRAYRNRLPNAIFMPHWPQPGLVPRAPQRGERFENLCFYGHSKNLARELQTVKWRQQLQNELGIQLHFPNVDQWHDYSQTDCVIAVRDFSESPHWNKPATKLYNAWLAGVPFIGGRDSAYAADGRPGVDYLAASSPEEVFEQLRYLKENISFRSELVAQGTQASKEFTRAAILNRWKQLVEKTIPELADQWNQKTKPQRYFFSQRQKLHLFLESHSWSYFFKKPAPPSLEIKFIIPKATFPSDEWIQAWNEERLVSLQEGTKCVTSYSWIYQTWSLLKKSGLSCSLVHEFPISDIVLFLSMSLKSKSSHSLKSHLFFVDIVAHSRPHPVAQLHLVHNKAHARWLPRSFFIPHWPQPYLIPRDLKRGDRFENICFVGDPEQLASEFLSPAWNKRLEKELQLQFEVKPPDQWHDYSNIDAVIAIRGFSSNRYLNKPATKLYNAWHAGVPFIGGLDSAYAADGRPGIDYLVASSLEEAFQHLRHLKENPSLRHQLVFHGAESRKIFTREAILQQWKIFLLEVLPKRVDQWQKKSLLERRFFMITQRLICFLDRYRR